MVKTICIAVGAAAVAGLAALIILSVELERFAEDICPHRQEDEKSEY